jgi:hypothetical protein
MNVTRFAASTARRRSRAATAMRSVSSAPVNSVRSPARSSDADLSSESMITRAFVQFAAFASS